MFSPVTTFTAVDLSLLLQFNEQFEINSLDSCSLHSLRNYSSLSVLVQSLYLKDQRPLKSIAATCLKEREIF